MNTTTLPALLGAIVLACACHGSATAKLPPMGDEAKAKAAETAAKGDWTGKVGAYQLCQVQNRIAGSYHASAGGAASAVVATPACADPGAFAYNAEKAAPPLEAAGAHSPAATAVAPPNSKVPDAEQKPAAKLEAAGAHSPASTATSPPAAKASGVDQKPMPK